MEWIKVTDRLPENYQQVLVTTQIENYPRYVHEGLRSGKNWVVPGTCVKSDDIIAWAYMPEPFMD